MDNRKRTRQPASGHDPERTHTLSGPHDRQATTHDPRADARPERPPRSLSGNPRSLSGNPRSLSGNPRSLSLTKGGHLRFVEPSQRHGAFRFWPAAGFG